MRIRHNDMVGLIGEFSRAIPPFLSHDLAGKWIEWLCRVASLMLRCKPDDVFWAIQAFEAEAELWADGDDAAHQPNHLSDADWAAACEMLRGDEDPDRNDYMANIDWIPVNTDIDVELAEDRNHILGGDDIDYANEWARDYDLPDPPDEDFQENTSPDRGGSKKDSDDERAPPGERKEELISQPILTATEGVLCTIPDQKNVPLSRIEARSNWVTAAANRSSRRGGILHLLSVFPDGAANMSMDGYEKLMKDHLPLSAGFEQALWLEEHQDDFPWLMRLLGKVVIDWWGTDLSGRKKSRGIVRMRPSLGRWKAGIEWFSPSFVFRDERLSDKIRIAVFAS